LTLSSLISTLGVNNPALSSHSTSANIFIFVKNTLANFEYLTTLTSINNANALKNLGIRLNKKFYWTVHVASLVSSLSNRVIKCISSNKFNCNHLTILNIIKALILWKIDIGLPFYGNCSASTIKPIKTIYHSAIISALGSFRSTPIHNILFVSIDIQIKFCISKTIKPILLSHNSPL